MLTTGSFRRSSAGGTKIRSGAVRMLNTQRFERRVSGRGGIQVDNSGGVMFMMVVRDKRDTQRSR